MTKITPEEAINLLNLHDTLERKQNDVEVYKSVSHQQAVAIAYLIRDMDNVVQAAEDLLRDCRDKNKCSTLCEPPWGEGCPGIGICKALERLEGGK
ncbi:MAG: hypothetical protein H6Q69_5029 [Firmicutes bacterium]|nr:hypothetical protein [Bacillota bacterium]